MTFCFESGNEASHSTEQWSLGTRLVTLGTRIPCILRDSTLHTTQDTAEAGCSSPEVYSGICQGYLQQQQMCLGMTGNGVSIPRGRGDEMQAQLFITNLPAFLTLSPGCDAVIEQFLCFYIFGLCDGSGELYLPSSGECRMVTEETCGPELEQAMVFIAGIPGIQLPQCDTLPVSSTPGSLECLAGDRHTVVSAEYVSFP